MDEDEFVVFYAVDEGEVAVLAVQNVVVGGVVVDFGDLTLVDDLDGLGGGEDLGVED